MTVAVREGLLRVSDPAAASFVTATVGMLVAGGIVLGGEHLEGTSFRRLGLGVALAAAALIAVRDNFARWAARHYDIPGLASGWAALAGASALILVYLLVTRRGGTFAAV